MPLELTIGNHQNAITIPHHWIPQLELATQQAADLARLHLTSPLAPLASLEEIDIALVDDDTSNQVHLDFMDIPGATDVITFHHGEIVIGVEVALRQANEFNEPFPRELFRYIVHGLLHLAGHEDADPADRATMESHQEAIIASLWPSLAPVLLD